jgi:hypothetical protein
MRPKIKESLPRRFHPSLPFCHIFRKNLAPKLAKVTVDPRCPPIDAGGMHGTAAQLSGTQAHMQFVLSH